MSPLLLLVMLLPFEAVFFGFTSLTRWGVMGVLLMTAFLVIATHSLPCPDRRLWLPVFYLALTGLILLSGVLGTFWNSGIGGSTFRLTPVLTSLTQPLLALSVYYLLWRFQMTGSLVYSLIAVGVILCLLNLAQAFGLLPVLGRTLEARSFGGLTPSFVRSSPVEVFGTFGVLAMAALGFMLARIIDIRARFFRYRLLLLGTISLVVCALLLTQSRSTYLGMVCIFLLTIGFIRNRFWRYGVLLLTGLILVSVASRMIENMIYADPKTIYYRLTTFQQAIDAFQSSPVFGVGWDISLLVNVQDKLLHNSFLALLGYLGLAGFLPHVCAYVITAVFAYTFYQKNERPSENWIFLGIVLAMTGWFVENMFYLGVREYAVWVFQGLFLYLATSRPPTIPSLSPHSQGSATFLAGDSSPVGKRERHIC